MAEHARLQVALAAEGVDQGAVFLLRNGVDREVAARQVLLQRDVGRRVKQEALVSRPGLAFGARERVFLVGLRMQETLPAAPPPPTT
jgi:hypothetical protein